MGQYMMVIRKIRTSDDYKTVDDVVFNGDYGSTYSKFKSALDGSDWFKNHSPRKNGVLVVLIEFRFMNGDNVDLELWTEDCFAWVRQKFVMAKMSIIGTSVFQDGTDSGHAYIAFIPFLQNGRISYDHFFGSAIKMRDLQSEFGILMKSKYKLSRTAAGSSKLAANSVIVGGIVQPLLTKPTPSMSIEAYEKIAEAEYKNLLIRYMSLKEEYDSCKREAETSLSQNTLTAYSDRYIQFIEKNGSIDSCEKLILLAKKLQYGVRSLKDAGNTDGVTYVNNVLKAGEVYMSRVEQSMQNKTTPMAHS